MEANIRKLLPRQVFGKKLVISVISLILFVGVILYAVYETTKATVTLSLNDEEYTVQTHASTVAEFMMEQNWEVREYDKIEPGLEEKITGNMSISWIPAQEVNVTIEGKKQVVWTTANTVKELIDELEIAYSEHDKIEPALSAEISENLDIIYESAFQVDLTSDGEQREIWTTSTTVADFLEKENVSLGELDRVEPALDEQVNEETDIRVIRVEKVTDVVEETVAFGTVTRKDNNLDNGKEKVVQAGKQGRVNKHYEVVLEDGKEVSRELIETETVQESKDKIVAVGTRPTAPSVSRGSSPTQSQGAKKGRTLTVTATAYTAVCSGCTGITATGINLNNNRNAKVIAVDPNVIPLGSRVHVEGYGTAIAGDTGGAINGNKIDVHVATKAEARRWGRKQVKITILE